MWSVHLQYLSMIELDIEGPLPTSREPPFPILVPTPSQESLAHLAICFSAISSSWFCCTRVKLGKLEEKKCQHQSAFENFLVCLVFDFGPLGAMLRAYFWICTQWLLMTQRQGPYGVPGIKSRLLTCKSSAFPSAITLTFKMLKVNKSLNCVTPQGKDTGRLSEWILDLYSSHTYIHLSFLKYW